MKSSTKRSCRALPLLYTLTVAKGFVVTRSNHPRCRDNMQARAAAADGDPLHIALTREDGKNNKLKKSLLNLFGNDRITPIEIPCIAHADGDDYSQLSTSLKEESWDFVAVTSPEAARVLSTSWDFEKSIPVAVVGKATEKALKDLGIPVSFCPSKALASVLATELPGNAGTRVLYPCSAKAKKILQDGLSERGFEVVRLNTYDTVTAVWTDAQIQAAKECQVACFGSPSAVDGWLKNTNDRRDIMASCIGKTSADACLDKGWKSQDIFYPGKPGMEGWVNAVDEASNALHARIVEQQ